MADQPHSTVDQNRRAWNAGRYQAWIEGVGPPEVEAARLVADPRAKLRRLLPHARTVAGRRICNIQGSHGRVAVAFALLGAQATVIDFAEENRRYALELATAAGVALDYELADVIQADKLGLRPFDLTVIELGVLHYHQDLARFFRVMAALTTGGGRMLINEFHPIERKLFQDFDGAPRDYFHTGLVAADVPDPTGTGRSLGRCAYRYWTLGEIVTAVAEAGFAIERLEEHPSWTDPTTPGTFTLVAGKPAQDQRRP
jgi:2-polyprenyl-3-methyl-5-hydroxy-6-metoxy-1,4-benzoquinol methylase